MNTQSMLRIGTRNSALARWQAEWVAGQLRDLGNEVELVPIVTQGDADQQRPLEALSSTPGVFTKELQRALLDGRIDLAVHSLKDLPTIEVPGLILAVVPPRENPLDVLVATQGTSLLTLPQGAIIGTGSLRRRAQLLHLRPDLVLREIRGNVDTRLRKLRAGEYDALVLAAAGLHRLGLADAITAEIPIDVMCPAVGQGALGIECRAEDAATQAALTPLDDAATHRAVRAERSLLRELLGGCLAPIGAHAAVVRSGAAGSPDLKQLFGPLAARAGALPDDLSLQGVVLAPDGSQKISAQARGSDPEALGVAVAQDLLGQGAAPLIAAARA